MTVDGGQFDAPRLRRLFQEISAALQRREQRAQLFVVGGAAMALGYGGERLTRDVDAVYAPTSVVRELAAEIGERHGFEPDWINDGAKGFMPGNDDGPRTVFESEWLLVQVGSPEYLLAMKLLAARDERDLDDAVSLFVAAGFTTSEEGISLLERRYPPAMLLPRHRYVVDEIARRAAARRGREEATDGTER